MFLKAVGPLKHRYLIRVGGLAKYLIWKHLILGGKSILTKVRVVLISRILI